MTTGLLTRVDLHTPKMLSIQLQTTKNVIEQFHTSCYSYLSQMKPIKEPLVVRF